MAYFRETRNPETTTMLREMSEYFVPFTPGLDNLYQKLIESLGRHQKTFGDKPKPRIVLATTNYDLLIECAILNAGCAVVYPTPDSDADLTYAELPADADLPAKERSVHYWSPRIDHGVEHQLNYKLESDQTSVVRFPAFEVPKVHGSCNFAPQLGRYKFHNTVLEGGVANLVGAPVQPLLPANRALQWLKETDSLAPAIAVYEAGKQVLFSPEYVQEHQRRFQTAVAEAEKVFLVGIRIVPEDGHVWDHVAASNAWLGYVGFEPKEFRAWCEANGYSNYRTLARSFKEALPLIEEEIEDLVP